MADNFSNNLLIILRVDSVSVKIGKNWQKLAKFGKNWHKSSNTLQYDNIFCIVCESKCDLYKLNHSNSGEGQKLKFLWKKSSLLNFQNLVICL